MQRVRKFELSKERTAFVNCAKEGRNVLVNICIGSGKTTAIQRLCDELTGEFNILYLTYNRLLKYDAKSKSKNINEAVTNYHGFTLNSLKRLGIAASVQDGQLFDSINRK